MPKLPERQAPSVLLLCQPQHVLLPHGLGWLLEASHHVHTSTSRKEEEEEKTSLLSPSP